MPTNRTGLEVPGLDTLDGLPGFTIERRATSSRHTGPFETRKPGPSGPPPPRRGLGEEAPLLLLRALAGRLSQRRRPLGSSDATRSASSAAAAAARPTIHRPPPPPPAVHPRPRHVPTCAPSPRDTAHAPRRSAAGRPPGPRAASDSPPDPGSLPGARSASLDAAAPGSGSMASRSQRSTRVSSCASRRGWSGTRDSITGSTSPSHDTRTHVRSQRRDFTVAVRSGASPSSVR